MQANNLRLDDGFSTTIELELAPTVKLYEKEITPPNITGGGGIETTTMRNTAWKTKAPKKLKMMGQVHTVCAYATDCIPVLFAQIQVNQRLTITFADGSSLRIWGWLDEFTPGAFKPDEQPTATVIFVPSMRDDNGAEVAPLYIDPPGDTGDTEA